MISPLQLLALECHARAHNGGLGDPVLLSQVRGAREGDAGCMRSLAANLEIMHQMGERVCVLVTLDEIVTVPAVNPTVDSLISDLKSERDAHQATVLELEAAQHAIADLTSRLKAMTDVATEANRDAMAALGIQPALESATRKITGRPYDEVNAALDRDVAAHPSEEP